MKKKARILSALLCSALLFTGCSKAEMREKYESLTGKEEKMSMELTKTAFSQSYKYQITIPESWEDLNSYMKTALIEGTDQMMVGNRANNTILDIYIANSSYVGFDSLFGSYIQGMNSEMGLNISRSDFAEKEFNGLKAQYIEVSDVVLPKSKDKTKYRIWSYCMDDEKGIIMFEAIMKQDDATDEMRDLIESMIQTFKKF